MKPANAVIPALLGWLIFTCACGAGGGPPTDHPPGENPCVVSGRAALDGTVCGSNQACQGGACVACVDGAPCVPDAARCHRGQLACGAAPTCADTGATANDGAACGVDQVCSNAVCVGCVEGEICQTGGACYYQSRMSCSQGPICLNALGDFPDGSTCVINGRVGTCESGRCVP